MSFDQPQPGDESYNDQDAADLGKQEEYAMSHSKVYVAIAKVMTAMAQEGISKRRSNQQQGYKFRGIDDVYNALAGHLAAAGLCVVPHYSERGVVERTTKGGSALFYVTVAGTFDLICVEDGSVYTAGPFFGEAMDSADKATNKAMSAAFKYFAMQTFCIPTEGDNDADATTHEVAGMDEAAQTALQELRDASMNGMAALERGWKGASADIRKALAGELAGLKLAAQQAERKAA